MQLTKSEPQCNICTNVDCSTTSSVANARLPLIVGVAVVVPRGTTWKVSGAFSSPSVFSPFPLFPPCVYARWEELGGFEFTTTEHLRHPDVRVSVVGTEEFPRKSRPPPVDRTCLRKPEDDELEIRLSGIWRRTLGIRLWSD